MKNHNEQLKSVPKIFGRFDNELVCSVCGEPDLGYEECDCGQFLGWMYKSEYDKQKMDEFTADLYDNQMPEE